MVLRLPALEQQAVVDGRLMKNTHYNSLLPAICHTHIQYQLKVFHLCEWLGQKGQKDGHIKVNEEGGKIHLVYTYIFTHTHSLHSITVAIQF